MAENRRIEVANLSGSAGEVAMVRFKDRKMIDTANIQELGEELFNLIEKEQKKNLILNFKGVEFLSSPVLNKLILLNKKAKACGGKMRLCNIPPEILKVFESTQLVRLFDIKSTDADALSGF